MKPRLRDENTHSVYVQCSHRSSMPCVTCMPGGGVVGGSGLCCCVPARVCTSSDRALLINSLC